MITATLLLVFTSFGHIATRVIASNVTAERYTVCPRGSTFNGRELFSCRRRSKLDCVQKCAHTEGCIGINVCPTGYDRKVSCSFLSEQSPDGCDALDAATDQTCFFVQKAVLQKTCQNGGTLNGNVCQCPIQYGGEYCHRYIRDCREAYENGYTSSSFNGVYLIQPMTTSQPFWVQCDFDYDGAMYVMKWKSMSLDVTWNQAKVGFGEDLEQNPNSNNFFIGLDNLHHLTSESSHRALVWMSASPSTAAAFYHNFTIGSEMRDYDLTYDSFVAGPNAPNTQNGFTAAAPLVFSSQDRDTNNCTSTRGAPGWYGSDCKGYSLFADIPIWPVGNYDVTASFFFLSLERQSKFYVDY
ncbi:hypothetical protein V1264_017361 [Littorina saxatilis]|uniref:Fibrinogen C-terminal domain-containing protein n=1 Tax=Littorina saxatilis TaxID=31220 RepID=A0AAN9BH24_9CAEN